MKKVILIIVVLIFSSFKGTEKNVYICNSENATKYHLSETCRGLNACKHKIIAITESKAKADGLTLCKWEN